jgi:hypothetical protein
MSNAMLVFPNPATTEVTVSFDYGTDTYKERSLCVYDELGRKMSYSLPEGIQGKWSLDTRNWPQGMYIIRMEADGATLQVQRMVVAH